MSDGSVQASDSLCVEVLLSYGEGALETQGSRAVGETHFLKNDLRVEPRRRGSFVWVLSSSQLVVEQVAPSSFLSR